MHQNRIMHKNEGGKYNCIFCCEEFKYILELKEHMDINHKSWKTNNCPLCSEKFDNFLKLKLHHEKTHDGDHVWRSKKIKKDNLRMVGCHLCIDYIGMITNKMSIITSFGQKFLSKHFMNFDIFHEHILILFYI